MMDTENPFAFNIWQKEPPLHLLIFRKCYDIHTRQYWFLSYRSRTD